MQNAGRFFSAIWQKRMNNSGNNRLVLFLLVSKLTMSTHCSMHVFVLPWVDFQVVVAGYSVNFYFLLWGRLKSGRKRNKQHDFEPWVDQTWTEVNLYATVGGVFCQATHHDGLVLYAEFLHSCPVQLPQQTHDAGFLPRTWWTVH